MSKHQNEGSKSNKEKITNGDNEIMDDGEDGQVGEKDSIEYQLGDLPDFVSDDEKPIIKQEPNTTCLINVNKLQEETKGAYNHCDIHKMDRMEKNVMCLQCEELICALCLLNSHQAHEIRSVSSLKEYFRVKSSMEEDVSVLQQEQNNLTVQFSQRKDLKRKIEESSDHLEQEIEKSFKVIREILQAKQEQLIAHIKQFENVNVADLNKEIDRIRDLENSASRMITRTITFFSQIDMKEALDLPPKLNEVIKHCKDANVKSIENKERCLPEKKFSKLLPSLDAVADICQRIHAEGTKVVWSKITKYSETEDKKDTKVKTEKRKHLSHSDHTADNSKTFKKPKPSSSSSTTPSSTTSTVSLPTLAVPHHRRSSTEKLEVKDKVKKTGEKSLFESLSESIANKEIITGSKVSHHRKSSVDSGSTITQSPHLSSEYDSESDRSDTSIVTPPNFKLVEIRATNIEIGKCLVAKLSENESEKIVLGKVLESSKMKETTQYTVNLFKGELGKDTSFEIRKKPSPVHSSCVICNFDFDHSKPMSAELKNELIMAKDYHSNSRKTRKRKSAPVKEKMSPKKDKEMGKANVTVKK